LTNSFLAFGKLKSFRILWTELETLWSSDCATQLKRKWRLTPSSLGNIPHKGRIMPTPPRFFSILHPYPLFEKNLPSRVAVPLLLQGYIYDAENAIADTINAADFNILLWRIRRIQLV